MARTTFLLLCSFAVLRHTASAGPAAETPILPPVIAWKLKDPSLTVAKNDPWVTPFETGDFNVTPRYPEMTAWLKRLVAAAPELHMVSLGKSHERRDVWMIIASKERAFTPEALRKSGKPTLFAQAGIHPGEIDGKDAGMMLLRDMTVRGNKKGLLDRANLLFVPIVGVDGHERFSRFARVNQRGPAEQGWRTNARNRNLNRDYAKLDTPELGAVVDAIVRFDPELYYDIHVTDGADYQYDITWDHNGKDAHSPASAAWIDASLNPRLTADLRAKGHIPGPLVFAVDGRDMKKGNRVISFSPRYSHGWGDLRHTPTLLVENHSLKPYDQRVFGTYVMLESTLEALGEHGAALRKAITQDRARRPDPVVLTWKDQDGEPPRKTFLGIESEIHHSKVSDGRFVRFSGRPVTLEIPFVHRSQPGVTVARPKAYWVPAAWPDVIERLKRHGITVEEIEKPRTLTLEVSRLVEPKLATSPFEGRVRLSTGEKRERLEMTYAPGSVRVATDQPLGDLAVTLLEPLSDDSLLQWGFFHEILQRTEYMEAYVVEPMAEAMLAEDPELAAAFRARLAADPAFARDPAARRRFFYEKTPFFDARWHLYPVGRE
ncbi:MAG: M14 family metallopeptidase [Planctomycetota bacterium]